MPLPSPAFTHCAAHDMPNLAGLLLLAGVLAVSGIAALVRRRRRGILGTYTPVATALQWIDSAPTLGAIGATANSRAIVVDQRGAAVAGGPTVSYSSGTTSVATVNSSGVVTSVANGSSVITASASGLTSITQTATVSQVVASISGVSSTLSTNDASSGTFSPSALDANGHAVSGATFSYASNNNSVITVNASTGLWAGQSAGTATITITANPGGYTFPIAVTVAHVTYTLTVTPSPITGANGGTVQVTVYEDTGSGPVDVTSDSQTVYSIADTTKATVDVPTLSSISPNTITQGTSASYTFTGTNIKGNETIGGLPSGVTASSYVYTSTTVVCTLTATSGATTGAASVDLVASGRGISGTQTLTVNSAVSTPTLSSASQTYAAQSTTQTIVLTGTNFDSNCTAVFSNAGVTVNSYGTITSTSLPVNISVSSGATTGAGTVKVHQSVGSLDSGTLAFTINAPVSRSALYLRASSAASLTPTSSHSGSLPLASNYTQNGGLTWRALSGNNGASGTGPYVQTLGGGSTQSAQWGGWASIALAAQTIASGTWTFKYGLYPESAATYQIAPVLYVWRPATQSVVGMIYDSNTGIGSTTAGYTSYTTAGKVTTFSGSAVTAQDGDVLVLEVWAVGTTSTILHLEYAGPTAITEGGDASSAKSELDSPVSLTYQV